MKILFTFENALPSNEADAEVFVTTATSMAPLMSGAWLYVPVSDPGDRAAIAARTGMKVIRARAPQQPAFLRHLFCGLSMVFAKAFRQADLVYTRNLWIAWIAICFGRNVAFDHYRPWSDQIPPLQFWIYRLMCKQHFLVNICHSEYTRQKYLALGIPAEKLRCIHNGFEPQRLKAALPLDEAKRWIGVSPDRPTIVYTGRINHKKGLALVLEAAKRLPELLFLLVGSYGDGPIEAMARGIENIRIVKWQSEDTVGQYIAAADILLIPPSSQPLATFGSTVLPLKLFFYMASGRPILAGDTPDVGELLVDGDNAVLCAPDSLEALTEGLRALAGDPARGARLAAAAQAQSRDFTWNARAGRIAAIVAERLASVSAEPGAWSIRQSRAWRRQSWRWLVHLIRTRSLILPSAPVPPTSG